jgi:hypothetical protein
MGALEEIGDGAKAVVTGVAGIVATFVGMFGDPTFLLTNFGLVATLSSWTAKYLGPEFAPGIPWDQVMLVVAFVGVVLTVSRLYSRRTND